MALHYIAQVLPSGYKIDSDIKLVYCRDNTEVHLKELLQV